MRDRVVHERGGEAAKSSNEVDAENGAHQHDHGDHHDHDHTHGELDHHHDEGSATDGQNGGTRLLKFSAVAVVVVAAAVGAGMFFNRSSTKSGKPVSKTATVVPAAKGAPNVAGSGAAPAGLAPVSARDAVELYLGAQVTGDQAGAYRLLSADTRTQLGTLATWEDGALSRPRILSFVVTAASGSTVTSNLVLQPRVDQVSGIVAGRAVATFAAVHDPDGWRVNLNGVTTTPAYPDDATATATASAWATGRQQCTKSGQYGGPLLGQPALAEQLCKTSGDLSVGKPGRITTTSFLGTAISNAFGPSSLNVTRLVTVEGGPRSLDVALAPLGDAWVVVGVASHV